MSVIKHENQMKNVHDQSLQEQEVWKQMLQVESGLSQNTKEFIPLRQQKLSGDIPMLQYTAEQAAVGKNGEGYTESDATIRHKKHDRETMPYG